MHEDTSSALSPRAWLTLNRTKWTLDISSLCRLAGYISKQAKCVLGLCIYCAALCCSACTAFAPEQRGMELLQLPPSFAWDVDGSRAVSSWWRGFNSSELNTLMETALSENFDLQTSLARLRQAQATADQARAGIFPGLDAEAEASRSRIYRDHVLQEDQKSMSLAAAASYELDLWGRIWSGYRADQLSARAASEDLRAAAISLTGEVVGVWVELLAARHEMQVVEEQIQTNEKLLRLQISRFENGMASALDVTQQQELLASSRSVLPPLKAQDRKAANRLTDLTGHSDVQDISIQARTLPPPLPRANTGIPADLLMSRPDVRAAFARLRSADWEVSSAVANRLPSLSLTARTALDSDSFRLAWGDWLNRLGTSLTAPLFDAGARAAEVERAKAVVDERLAEYSAAVLEAIREVQDALADIRSRGQRINRIEEELQAAKQAREQARLRYLKGQSDYLNFVTQQRSVQDLQRSLVSAKADLLSSQIALYRALGT